MTLFLIACATFGFQTSESPPAASAKESELLRLLERNPEL
jgi:hypothetical protein